MYDWLVELHQTQPHLPRVLMAGTLVSTTCGALGCFIILRRMAFLGDALAHSMLAGVVSGYLLMKLVFGSEANAPLGRAVIGGLVAGLVTTLLVVPCLYAWMIRQDAADSATETTSPA